MRKFLLGLVVGGLVVVSGVAVASIPDNQGVIHGCYKSTSGVLRVIDNSTQSCSPTETAIFWSQTGPRGPVGLSGQPALGVPFRAEVDDVDCGFNGTGSTGCGYPSFGGPGGNDSVVMTFSGPGYGKLDCGNGAYITTSNKVLGLNLHDHGFSANVECTISPFVLNTETPFPGAEPVTFTAYYVG